MNPYGDIADCMSGAQIAESDALPSVAPAYYGITSQHRRSGEVV